MELCYLFYAKQHKIAFLSAVFQSIIIKHKGQCETNMTPLKRNYSLQCSVAQSISTKFSHTQRCQHIHCYHPAFIESIKNKIHLSTLAEHQIFHR
jgi:hypothetical protein